ncbi:MAG: hypothetical protein J6V25_04880, partial [Oscillospiraceae bacterium]|nr:hypothetical protein [Oscillospiraceae bacterium]
MRKVTDGYIRYLIRLKSMSKYVRSLLLILSFAVALSVFWSLKLIGITMAGEAFCGKTEHVHSEECPTSILRCTLEEGPSHMHTEACLFHKLVCETEEVEAHYHNDACASYILVCEKPEAPAHAHGSDCYGRMLQCGMDEDPEHTHTNDCYVQNPDELLCGVTDIAGHTHEGACYAVEEGVYSCGLEQTDGHTHGTLCYEIGPGFICGKLEADGHTHSMECIGEDTRFGCGLAISDGHTHTEICYEDVESCPLEEHVHEPNCYSNYEADLETSDDWEMTLMGITRSPVTAENVVAVARSQVGYTESTLNFMVDENGIRRGITLANGIGVIDSDYRGPLGVGLFNTND